MAPFGSVNLVKLVDVTLLWLHQPEEATLSILGKVFDHTTGWDIRLIYGPCTGDQVRGELEVDR